MVAIKNKVWIVLILCFGALTVSVNAADVSIEVDRDSIALDETFNVVFTYADQFKGEPDFSLLENNFQIVSQNRRSNLQIINGNYQYELSWVLTLLPKRAGALTIVSIPFGVDQSPERTIAVTPAAKRTEDDLGDIFLETELTPNEGFVQGQYLFTVRIFFRGWLIDGDLSEPDIGSQDIVVQSLGEPKRFAKTRNGERYQVYERRHALFPQASGMMTIEPTIFSGRLRLPSGSKRLKRVTAEGISTEVKPSPTSFSGKVWLPAHDVQIEEIWPSDTLIFEQGVPITRTLTIKATGLSSAQLPQLDIANTDEFRVYPDQPSKADRLVDGSVVGERTQSVALVPQVAGDVTLPAVELVWWDTVNNREQIARVPPRTITVAARSVPVANDTSTSTPPLTLAVTSWYKDPWFWTALGCALGWLVTLIRMPNSNSSSAPPSTEPTAFASPSLEHVRKSLRIACQSNDAAQARTLAEQYVRKLYALPAWRSLHHSADRLPSEFLSQWQQLNRTLYGPKSAATWSSGPEFWRVIDKLDNSQKGFKQAAPELQPL